jgi:hypothetical protein
MALSVRFRSADTHGPSYNAQDTAEDGIGILVASLGFREVVIR